jgi:ribonuclease-3
MAFIHKSYAADFKQEVVHNERLEFLGDAILGSVIAKQLYIDYPNAAESQLTLYKIALVREEHLAKIAKHIGLDQQLLLGNGEEKMGGRQKDVILADGLEALIGFLVLDQ